MLLTDRVKALLVVETTSRLSLNNPFDFYFVIQLLFDV